MLKPISAAKGIFWPALPNLLNAQLLALQYQFDQSQWLPLEEIEKLQMRQLMAVLNHAYQTVPFYQQRLDFLRKLEGSFLTYDDFRDIPILKRQDLQEHAQELISVAIPEDHLPTTESSTSGSTGKPITFQATNVKGLFFRALNLRNHLWHRHDPRAKLAVIRVPRTRWKQEEEEVPPNPQGSSVPWMDVFVTGPVVEFDSGKTVSEQLAWLQRENPNHLVTYPSNLAALAKQAHAQQITLSNLTNLGTVGEVLTPEIRQVCREVWGLPIVDIYSCQELGILALQCPDHEHYHIQSECVMVEVLDDNNQPCQPGQVGRVVITDLQNYAMPFIRYEIGDYAEVGSPCPCNRSLPTLKQVLGRTRNMLVLPSGEKIWPSFILSKWAKIAPIRQIQVVQHSQTEIEVKLVLTEAMDEALESRLYKVIAHDLGDTRFSIRLSCVDQIPRSNSGKYEDFISKI